MWSKCYAAIKHAGCQLLVVVPKIDISLLARILPAVKVPLTFD